MEKRLRILDSMYKATAPRQELADATINGKPISIEAYVKKDNPNKPQYVNRKSGMNDVFTNIFIRNLPDSVRSLADLVTLFVDFGPVISARIILDKKAGFCNMADHDSAVRALNGLNGKILYGNTLITCRALTKEERLAFHQKSA
ncbi:RNA binding [Trichomonas vaginalis G3]|uniref:RNA binding n=1 Tax=Trichomonas vaginalis (strain ATCC PRA-98 / G3) TaxID=412133 RepID=UPI0021E55E32|nr:RNA binding [Trichomonas vaginalis G3]KAI5508402.1 RNA binding [Trichomonas vaginalis G3]